MYNLNPDIKLIKSISNFKYKNVYLLVKKITLKNFSDGEEMT